MSWFNHTPKKWPTEPSPAPDPYDPSDTFWPPENE